MRAFLAALVIVTAFLAGCSDGGGGGDEGTDTSNPTPSGTSTATGTGSGKTPTGTSSSSGSATNAPGNSAPTAQLAASVATGAAPLRVNFTLGGSDADGDALAWTLAVGDASADKTGTALPATVSHNYTAAGQYNVTLTVSDGKASANQTLSINVTAGGGSSGLVLTGDTADACLACSGIGIGGVGVPATGGKGCVSFRTEEAGGDCIWFELPATAIGRPFTSTSTGGDPDIEFATSCDADYESVDFFFEVGPEAGEVPATSACVFLWEFEAADSTHTFTVS